MSDSVSVDTTMTPVTSNTSTTSTPKGVTFAPSPPRSSSSGGILVNNDDSPDATLSPDELVLALREVRSDLAQARMDLSAEKAIRKRKEKNLVKLAKQLNTRTTTIDDQQKQINGLIEAQAKLETRLDTARQELEQLTERYEKASRDHHAEITEQQTKHRDLCRQHDDRVAELTAAHGRQSEELRREVLKSHLDADRLRVCGSGRTDAHTYRIIMVRLISIVSSLISYICSPFRYSLQTQIASIEMQNNPDSADAVVKRTMLESMASSRSSIAKGNGLTKSVVVAICAAFFIPIFAYFMFSGDAICAPCFPGTNLVDAPFIGEAPWWAPDSTKESMFSLLCGSDRIRTRIEWSGGSGASMLIVTNANEPPSKQRALVEKKALKADVGAEKIRATRANGKSEDIAAPWRMAD